jgi:hypothetical protein
MVIDLRRASRLSSAVFLPSIMMSPSRGIYKRVRRGAESTTGCFNSIEQGGTRSDESQHRESKGTFPATGTRADREFDEVLRSKFRWRRNKKRGESSVPSSPSCDPDHLSRVDGEVDVFEDDRTALGVSRAEIRNVDVARRGPVGWRNAGRRGLLLLRNRIEVFLNSFHGVTGDL